MTPADRLWKAIVSGMPRNSWMRLRDICEAVEARLTLDNDDLRPYMPGSRAPAWKHRVRELLLAPPGNARMEWNRRGSYRRR